MNSYISLSSYYDELFPPPEGLVRFLSENLEPNASILDLGCGTGSLVEKLNAAGFDSQGIDPDPEMINTGLQKNHLRPIQTGTIRDIKTPCFDAITCVGNVGSYWNKDDWRIQLEQISQKLRPGGLWIFQMICWDQLPALGHWNYAPRLVDDFRLEREYVFDKDGATFNLELRHKGILLAQHSHKLFRHHKDELDNIHATLPMDKTHEWSDWTQKPWTGQPNTATIQIWIKK